MLRGSPALGLCVSVCVWVEHVCALAPKASCWLFWGSDRGEGAAPGSLEKDCPARLSLQSPAGYPWGTLGLGTRPLGRSLEPGHPQLHVATLCTPMPLPDPSVERESSTSPASGSGEQLFPLWLPVSGPRSRVVPCSSPPPLRAWPALPCSSPKGARKTKPTPRSAPPPLTAPQGGCAG